MDRISLNKILLLLDWTKKKVETRLSERGTVYFHEREIWWASLGENIGSEENGKNRNFERPVLILKKISGDLFWAVPVTTVIREGTWYYTFPFGQEKRCLILTQMRALSSKRLLRRVDRISDDVFHVVRRKMREFLDIKANPPTDVEGFSGPSCEDNVPTE